MRRSTALAAAGQRQARWQALSTAVAFLILLVSIRNVKMTFFATVSIFLTLATTLGALVLDGWQLNVSEAITMAVAIGMCVDFTVHFATSYQHAPRIHAPSRAQRVTRSMTEMGASVSVAAFTTFMAGCALLPSQVLFFFQFGEFLVLWRWLALGVVRRRVELLEHIRDLKAVRRAKDRLQWAAWMTVERIHPWGRSSCIQRQRPLSVGAVEGYVAV